MSQKTYTVNNQRRLVDLNGDSKNFDLTFTCTSKDGAQFEVLVVDQTTLDSNPNLQYKQANGTISGNIVADKNVYQNYFLVLRAGKPCEVTVKIVKKDIEPKQRPPQFHQQRPSTSNSVQRPVQLKPPQKPSSSKWKTIAIIILILGGGALLYYFYTQNKNKKSSSTGTCPNTTLEATVTPSSPAPSNVSITPPSSNGQSGLLDRLKNLNMAN